MRFSNIIVREMGALSSPGMLIEFYECNCERDRPLSCPGILSDVTVPYGSWECGYERDQCLELLQGQRARDQMGDNHRKPEELL